MTLARLRGGRPQTIDPDKLERLGIARGTQYVRHNGAEFYAAGTVLTPDEAADGALLVKQREEVRDEASGQTLTVGMTFRQYLPVPAGTFAALHNGHRKPTGLRPADALAGLLLLRPRPALIAGLPGGIASGEAIVKRAPADAGQRRGYAEGRGPIRGRAILAAIESRGVQLIVRHGALLPLYAGRQLPAGVVDVIERAERLLLGYVAERDGTGQPLRCELEHDADPPEAWTLAVGGLAACRGHLEGVA